MRGKFGRPDASSDHFFATSSLFGGMRRIRSYFGIKPVGASQCEQMGKGGRYAPGARVGKADPRLRMAAAERLREQLTAVAAENGKLQRDLAKALAEADETKKENARLRVVNQSLQEELRAEVNARLERSTPSIPRHIRRAYADLAR